MRTSKDWKNPADDRLSLLAAGAHGPEKRGSWSSAGRCADLTAGKLGTRGGTASERAWARSPDQVVWKRDWHPQADRKQGRDIDGGEAKLDLEFLHEAVREKRAHRFWVLTTYTTLVNYQHSLAKVPFAAAVFDEIQALKNPFSMRAEAARSVKANFRIGLTGTPIENSATDLWAIMDQIAPGSLDSMEAFSAAMARRPRKTWRTFIGSCSSHAVLFRRLPSAGSNRQWSSDLPEKSRRLHPRRMPQHQSLAYEDAKLKLAQGGAGAALKMLHHIRTVSVHPLLEEVLPDADFISASARLRGCFRSATDDRKQRGTRACIHRAPQDAISLHRTGEGGIWPRECRANQWRYADQ